MYEITGDLFGHNEKGPNAICILTNGFTNAQRANAGCALQAKIRWPGIQMKIGDALYHGGNDCRLLTIEKDGQAILPVPGPWQAHDVPYHILMFPTKPDKVIDGHYDQLLDRYAPKVDYYSRPAAEYPGWMAKSNLPLIEKSTHQLAEITDQQDWKSVVLPRPGCGAGGLSWEDEVRPLLAGILDARFYVISQE
jgi:hypothetical protein